MSSDSVSSSVVPASPATSAVRSGLPEARRRVGAWWLVAAQIVFVLAVAAAGYATGALGETVTLHTTPIDPRDLNYGDHLNLSYSISQIPGSLWKGGAMPRRKQAVYVVLEPRQDRYEAVAVYSLEPTVPASQVILRGWVADVSRRSMRLRYGFEKYYVPAAVSRKLKPKQLLRVQVSVAPWGQARIKQVDILPAAKASITAP